MNTLLDISMATGPVIGYVHQYFLIKIDRTVGTFSIDICGILLFANILRLNFFIFNRYELALFFQSLIMIAAQICLIHICTKYANKKAQVTLEQKSPANRIYDEQSTIQRFWRWKQFSTYLCSIFAFAFTSFSLSIIFKQLQFQSYGVLVGLIALLSESLLIMPQILQNYQCQSTKGLSRVLVVLNLSGDILKLIYFLIKSQSFQFVMCGVIQVILDTFVVVQIVYYNRLQQEKFEKENKSLIIQQKKNSSPKKKESANILSEIQMKSVDQISPDDQDNQVLEDGYANNLQNDRNIKSPENQEKMHHVNQNYQVYEDQKSENENEDDQENDLQSIQKNAHQNQKTVNQKKLDIQ